MGHRRKARWTIRGFCDDRVLEVVFLAILQDLIGLKPRPTAGILTSNGRATDRSFVKWSNKRDKKLSIMESMKRYDEQFKKEIIGKFMAGRSVDMF